MKFCEYMKSDWFIALEREVNASNKTRVAEKMNVNRSTLSAVMNGIGEYGKGTASTVNFEREFRRAFEQLPCPYNGSNVGTTYCREHALSAAPTQNPLLMMHWQACQQCVHKPKPLAEPAPVGATSTAPRSGPQQQAGIIDKVTLPLPEVGGPKTRSRRAKTVALASAHDPAPAPQQAGIVDTVTMPLPEVGGPIVPDKSQPAIAFSV